MHPGTLLREHSPRLRQHERKSCAPERSALVWVCVLMVRDLCGRVTTQRCESARSVKKGREGGREGGFLLFARLRRSEVEHVKRSSPSSISICEAKVDLNGTGLRAPLLHSHEFESGQ